MERIKKSKNKRESGKIMKKIIILSLITKMEKSYILEDSIIMIDNLFNRFIPNITFGKGESCSLLNKRRKYNPPVNDRISGYPKRNLFRSEIKYKRPLYSKIS